MTRYHATAQGDVPFTQEEEAQWDAQEVLEIVAAQKRAIVNQIIAIELTITPRRQREAILGTDGGWLSARNSEIAALRAQL